MTVGPPGPPPGAELPDEPASAWGAQEPWWLPPLDREPTDAELHGAWPDPFAGPPGPQSWLERQAEPDEAEDAGAEASAGSGPAGAFADGGPAGAMTPGPVLAALSQDAFDAGLDKLSDDELVGVLQVARRLASWQAGVELHAVARLDALRRAQADRPGWSRVSEHVSAELAAALTLTGRSADELLGLARGLSRLPGVLRALLAGRIDRARAVVFAAELTALGDVAAAAVAAAFTLIAGSMTTGQLRAALRAMVLAVDPDAMRRRAEAGRAEARVESWQEGSGNCALAGRELPPAEVIAADARLTAIARALRAAGAPGGLDQLRVAVYTALLTGRDPGALIPAPASPADPAAGPASPAGLPHAGPASPASGAGSPAGDRADRPGDGRADRRGGGPSGRGGGAGPSRGDPAAAGRAERPSPGSLAGLAGSVHLTMPASAWLGLTDAPGEVAGHGPLDAGACRDLAARLAANPATRWCLTLTGPDGRAAAHACAPPGRKTAPPGPAGRSGQDRLAAMTRWLAGLPMAWLAAGRCGHARQAPGYRPGPQLAHLVTIRLRTCSFPGCRRPARRCDLDHTIPHDQGGPTCECNLAPLCRTHHRAKQAPGWHLAQPQPGTLTWTTPHGRSYTTTPDGYPV